MSLDGLKKCIDCNVEKSLLNFHKMKSSKDGHQYRCMECKREYCRKYCIENKEKRKLYSKEWRDNNKEKEVLYRMIYRRDNREALKEYNKNYYIENKEMILKSNKEWKDNNKEKSFLNKKIWRGTLHGKESDKGSNKKSNAKRYSTPKGKINSAISGGIYDSLKGNKQGRHWEGLVGYTLPELINHIENQFTDNMTWENYGNKKGCWSLDHILPISSFNFTSYDDEEFKQCWALENLRPLDHIENMKKGNKIIG